MGEKHSTYLILPGNYPKSVKVLFQTLFLYAWYF